ncbi:phage head spike fiber domain-containing protein [Enterobacter oligotrophicus]|uniref:phage head spike fiber domain-containing protein n=1 Tax=Enterobacter oligotrophicus TaxID=2478464 RepID=UPI0023F4881A|nr:hypothetical protein [Enterobacter oligotrophicus]
MGLYTRNSVILGKALGASVSDADLSDIDLMSRAPDRRVKFSGASQRAFRSANGTIQYAAPDEWPLEYRNGIPVGRHEPEMQSTNYLWHSANFSAWPAANSIVSATTEQWFDSSNAQFVIASATTTYTRVYQTPSLAAGDCVFSIIVKSGTTPYLHATLENSTRDHSTHFYADLATRTGGIISAVGSLPVTVTVSDFGGGWFSVIAKAVLPLTASYYAYFGAANAANTVKATQGDSIIVALAQIEQGSLITSPVITTDASVTRAASFATVSNPGMAASGIQIWYTDGAVTELDFNGAASVDIPTATQDWGTRYIERITYIKAATDPLRDIDLTTAELDSRVTYIRPGNLHYYAADGTIQQIGDDTWPLEYRDGVAAGRHEPEPQATNLKIGSRAPDAALYLLAKTGSTALSPAGIDELIEYKTTSTTATPALVTDITLAESSQLTISVFGRNGTAEMTVRKEGASSFASFTNEFTRSVLVTDYDATATRNRYSVFFPRTLGVIGYIWHMQFETGGIATSPIITGISAATRAAAFASVRIFNGATGLKITYNDGTDTTITFTGDEDGYCQLPQSSRDWGTRYITRIGYIRSE